MANYDKIANTAGISDRQLDCCVKGTRGAWKKLINTEDDGFIFLMK